MDPVMAQAMAQVTAQATAHNLSHLEEEETAEAEAPLLATLLLGPEEAEDEEEKEPESEDAMARKEAARRKRRAFLEKRRIAGQKEAIRVMRTKVQLLQQQYEKLCDAADLRRKKRPHRQQHQHQQTTTTDEGNSKQQAQEEKEDEALRAYLVPATTSLLFLARETQRLAFENAFLKDLVEQNAHFQHVVRAAADDLKLSVGRPLPTIHRMGHDVGGFCYVPFSREQCQEMVRRDYEANVLRKPAQFHERNNRPLPFGWHGFAFVHGHGAIHFQQTKTWPVHPDEAFELTWKLCHIPSKYQQYCAKPRSFEVLQEVSDDIIVIRRIMENTLTGSVNHSVYLLYCMRVGDAYLMGTVPLPLWGNGASVFLGDPYGKSLLRDKETLVFPQTYALYSPVEVLLGPPQPACATAGGEEVVTTPSVVHTRFLRWGTHVCDSADDVAFLLTEMLDGMLRFESLLLFPFFTKTIKA